MRYPHKDNRPAYHQWYGLQRWKRLRAAHRRKSPLCAMCLTQGVVTAVQVVDHVVPHKGDELLFWDAGNLQSLCKHHHDSTKSRMERSGSTNMGYDADGKPLDPSHPWSKAHIKT